MLELDSKYDVIWAIHSFTTVDRARMADVIGHLVSLLMPGGHFYIYQLTSQSTYQRLYEHYRHRRAPEIPRYMEFEDSIEILARMGVSFEVHPLEFRHSVPMDQPELLDKYLKKCILDDSVEVLKLFMDLLPEYRDGAEYQFPQTVNFVDVKSETP